jgi:cytochrome c2
MDLIDLGKKTEEEYRCIACHVIAGDGGLVGPELTYEGDKNPEFLDFTHVEGPQTALNWHRKHFQDPQAVLEGSAMPNLGLNEKETMALALLMVSWRRQSFPPEYVPPSHKPTLAGVPPIVRDVPAPSKKETDTPFEESGRQVFQARGCHTCHIVGEGKRIGPDLRGIAQRRSEEWLTSWLADPAAMIRATPALQAWPAEYGGIIMPNQNLTAEEIQAVIAYMRTL